MSTYPWAVEGYMGESRVAKYVESLTRQGGLILFKNSSLSLCYAGFGQSDCLFKIFKPLRML